MGPIVLEQGKNDTLVVRGTKLQDVYQFQTESATGLAFGAVQWSTDALGECFPSRWWWTAQPASAAGDAGCWIDQQHRHACHHGDVCPPASRPAAMTLCTPNPTGTAHHAPFAPTYLFVQETRHVQNHLDQPPKPPIQPTSTSGATRLGSRVGGTQRFRVRQWQHGADGALAPTVNTEITRPASGILNYTTVNIPAGVTVTFKKKNALDTHGVHAGQWQRHYRRGQSTPAGPMHRTPARRATATKPMTGCRAPVAPAALMAGGVAKSDQAQKRVGDSRWRRSGPGAGLGVLKGRRSRVPMTVTTAVLGQSPPGTATPLSQENANLDHELLPTVAPSRNYNGKAYRFCRFWSP